MSSVLAVFLCSAFSAPEQQSDKPRESEIENLIKELYKNPLDGPAAINTCLGSNSIWGVWLDTPMKKILEIGPATQDALLKKLPDGEIKDKVMILLGGLGDERVIAPIIDAMIDEKDIKTIAKAREINLAANVALTNITVADVVYPYQGGCLGSDRCRDNAKQCWQKWWKENQGKFKIGRITQDRNYGNYPNYGIYKRP
jgi:hypothetical protein